jgi:hypothetical protein
LREENLWKKGVCENKRHSKICLRSDAICLLILFAIWAGNCEMVLIELTYPNMYLGSSRHWVDLYLLFLNKLSLHWYNNQMRQNAPYSAKNIIWNLYNSNIIYDIHNSFLSYYKTIFMKSYRLKQFHIYNKFWWITSLSSFGLYIYIFLSPLLILYQLQSHYLCLITHLSSIYTLFSENEQKENKRPIGNQFRYS